MTARMPKILIVSHGHPALVAGCAEIAAYDLFRELNQSGVAEASFLGCITAQHRMPPADSAVQVFEGSSNEYLLHVGAFDPFMLAHGIDSRSLDDFGRFLDAIKPDLVHFHHLNLLCPQQVPHSLCYDLPVQFQYSQDD